MLGIALKELSGNGLVFAFVIVGITMYLSYQLSERLTRGRVHASAIAIVAGLVLAYIGGAFSGGGTKGLASIPLFSGMGLMGGAMLRDLAITATAFGVDLKEVKRSGLSGSVSLIVGILGSFVIGALFAVMFEVAGLSETA